MSPLIDLAERMVDASPAPALLVGAEGLRRVNARAASLFGFDESSDDAGSVRSLLGVGWRELDVIARSGGGGLVTDLPAGGSGEGRRRGARVRIERVVDADGGTLAIVAFVDAEAAETRPVPPTRRPPHGPGRGATAQGFDAMFGLDPDVLATMAAGRRFARTLLPVLLLAETGTGKELMARALHHESARRDQPFVAINCGALSPHLLESELFGYAPGAFTGARREGHDGKIGAARGGTLFLDEVAEMPGPLQALLLRVLEDGTYYRVGDNRPRQADVRLICATCRDLPRLVRDGGFRQDLFYRIHGACLGLPPLRRRTDVAELALHLLKQLVELGSAAAGPGAERTRAPELTPRALRWIVEHPWPGNVRELKTALQHALILCDSDAIDVEHLPPRLDGVFGRPDPPALSVGASVDEAPSVESPSAEAPAGEDGDREPAAPQASTARPKTLAERELERLVRSVDEADGNLSRAARALGIARSTLYRRLRKHGLIE